MKRLEKEAQARWELFGSEARELVALGFVLPAKMLSELVQVDVDGAGNPIEEHVSVMGAPSVIWYELENIAGVGEFFVDGEHLQSVLKVALTELGSDPSIVGTHAADQMSKANEIPRVLWHSHYLAIEPSDADIAEFPEWLVTRGLVYHAPSHTTTPYDHSGVISPLSTAIDPSLSTAEDV